MTAQETTDIFDPGLLFTKYKSAVERTDPIKHNGEVQRVRGLKIESRGPQAIVGELCQIIVSKEKTIWAEVIALEGHTVHLMTFEETEGIEIGCVVVAMGETLSIPVSEKLLGRTIDFMGRPIDGKGDIGSSELYSIFQKAPDVIQRKKIQQRITTGIRSIDGITPVGKGQRLGVFSGSGIGKSTLIAMIARNTSADVNVIALIGERGREVREFIENDLGEEGLKRSVVVVSSSNLPPLARLRGAYVATAIAEYFREKGNDVMFLFDSVTRFARAQREIGLASGEVPATRGFPPSVFSLLPQLLERCGTSAKGTITGFYSVLVEGDDMDEPIADTIRGILDGHVVLSRQIAQRYQYPAVDVLQSVSRLAEKVSGEKTKEAMGYLRRMIAVYREAEDLINVGAYVKGSNPEIDEAVEKIDAIRKFLTQGIYEKVTMEDTLKKAAEISGIDIPEQELKNEAVSLQT